MLDTDELPEIVYKGQPIIPLRASGSILFMDPKYLKPFDDYELYESQSPGMSYIAVKSGFSLRAIILPKRIVDEDFAEKMRVIAELSRMELEKQVSRLMPEDRPD